VPLSSLLVLQLVPSQEFEYYTRAGTTTYFNTGNTYPYGKNQVVSWYPGRPSDPGSKVVNLTVAEFPANAWGLYDTHGNVEEWCLDAWAHYGDGGGEVTVSSAATPAAAWSGGLDPPFRVTRGGSHSTELYYLRSANRAAALAVDSSWFIGFRVVMIPSPTMLAEAEVERAVDVVHLRGSAEWEAHSAAASRHLEGVLAEAEAAASARGMKVFPVHSHYAGSEVSVSSPLFLPPLQYVGATCRMERIPFW
jgi:hypothetical protein